MNIHTITSQDSYDNTYLSSNPPDNSGNLQYTTSTSSKLRSKSAVKPTNSSQIDLQSVISQYQGNPELLRLILSSKVEEDKRRTEEAKLKTKELDLYIKTQNSTTNSSSRADNRANRNLYSDSILGFQHRRSSSSSISSTSSTTGGSIHRRINPYSTPVCHTRPITVAPQRRNSAGISIYSINNNINQATSSVPISKSASIPLDSPYSQSLTYENFHQALPDVNNKILPSKTRRRRSMQAITKIIETTEFPYDDRHFWKNNGNTIQRKTGCRSIYYKCANSYKGCPVNKTVIEQPDGSYVIKYRGDHIEKCGQVEHIRDL